MGVVMDERARELYLEEWRHVELSRVSYIFALTGQTDEFGQTYTEETISDNSYWWQRVSKYNNFYNSGIKNTFRCGIYDCSLSYLFIRYLKALSMQTEKDVSTRIRDMPVMNTMLLRLII